MLKKHFAILALSIFFLAQFGRVINFCFCSLAVYEKTKSFTCDCEKQLYTAVKAGTHSGDQFPQHISSQLPSEELYHLPDAEPAAILQAVIFTAWPSSADAALYHCFGNGIFHPPLLVS